MTTAMVSDVVVYLRVGTGAQEKSGLGLEVQRDYVQAAARQQGWTIVAERSTICPKSALSSYLSPKQNKLLLS